MFWVLVPTVVSKDVLWAMRLALNRQQVELQRTDSGNHGAMKAKRQLGALTGPYLFLSLNGTHVKRGINKRHHMIAVRPAGPSQRAGRSH